MNKEQYILIQIWNHSKNILRIKLFAGLLVKNKKKNKKLAQCEFTINYQTLADISLEKTKHNTLHFKYRK